MKKYLIILAFFILSLPSYSNNYETIVSNIYVNNDKSYDIELMILKNGEILIPFKSLSELFDAKVVVNHKNNNIYFEVKDKKGEISREQIKYDNKVISNFKNVYLKKGLMEETRDEIFCNSFDLEKIFNSKINVDKCELSVYLETKSLCEKFEDVNSNQDFDVDKRKIRAYKNIKAPNKEQWITFNTLTFSNNTLSDVINQYSEGYSESNFLLNNNSEVALFGKMFSGEYKLDLSSYSFKDKYFNFGGIGFNYKNKYKNFEYELGKPTGIIRDDRVIGNNIYGFQVRNYNSKIEKIRDISGFVDRESTVKVLLDNKKEQNLSTYDGYYSLDDIVLNEEPKRVTVLEMKNDNSSKVILDKELNNPKILKKNEKRYDFILGVSGYNNKLFTQNNYIYKMNTKKYVSGVNFLYGIDEHKKLNSMLFVDKIYTKNQDSFMENVYSSDILLTSGTYKNPNNLEGITKLDTIYLNDDLPISHKIDFGLSKSSDKINSKDSLYGYNVSFSTLIKSKKYRFKVEIFNISPDFYMAGSNGGFISDRLGGGISYFLDKNGLLLNLKYKKYLSNLDKKYDGGYINFKEYNLSATKNFKKLGHFRFTINGRDGLNSFASNSSYYYNFTFSKQFNHNFYFDIGNQASSYVTEYQNKDFNNFESKFSTIYANFDYKLPKNFGAIRVGHDISSYTYNQQENNYNVAKIKYTFPEIKNITLSLNTGYKYQSLEKGFDFGINLAYRTKSNRIINISYQYNKTGGYLINNMFLPASDRHSLNITLNDAFKIMPRHLKSIGTFNADLGHVEIITYIDKNNNKKFDSEDIRVKNVPIKCSWENDIIYTNFKGKAYPNGISSGIYTVEVFSDKLQATLFQDKSEQSKKQIRIKNNQITKIEFPLKSCVGNISGKLLIQDEFKRNMNIKDFIVVLLDEKDNEVAYSTVDNDGNYYLSGIEPGEYVLKLDNYFIEENDLKEVLGKGRIKIDIPYQYKKFIELKNVDLIYQTISI